MCVAPPAVSSAMLCFCLFSYPQMSEISRLFSSFSSSSLHLRPHSGSAFQLADPSPERLTLCLIIKMLTMLSLSSQAHSLISASEYLRNAECWLVVGRLRCAWKGCLWPLEPNLRSAASWSLNLCLVGRKCGVWNGIWTKMHVLCSYWNLQLPNHSLTSVPLLPLIGY